MAQMALVISGIVIAIVTDWRMRKIPNWLTFSLVVLGFGLNIFEGGIAGFEKSSLGFGVGILLLLLPFHSGGVGGGDVKLLAAIGSFLGPVLIFKVFLASAIFGGLFALVFALKRKKLGQIWSHIKAKIFYLLITKKVLLESDVAKERFFIPYSLAIGCGFLFTLLLILKGG
ncbi:MAG: prepilin peptidase [Candidatus Omnitrophica bacterium]|nr:prepilin peptidase [Candidatus Omnitrophota bacterium]